MERVISQHFFFFLHHHFAEGDENCFEKKKKIRVLLSPEKTANSGFMFPFFSPFFGWGVFFLPFFGLSELYPPGLTVVGSFRENGRVLD